MTIDPYWLTLTAALSIGYLIGSVPFGLVLGKLFKVGDIRTIGSGNIGATNALRTGNKTFALLVLLCDGIKGAVAMCVVYYLIANATPALVMNTGIAAIIGHIFPLWLRFKGGKGVATSLGVVAALSIPVGLMIAVMWLMTARLSRYSSLAAILAFLNAPIYAQAANIPVLVTPLATIAVLLIWTHRANLQRLVTGDEPTINLKKKD